MILLTHTKRTSKVLTPRAVKRHMDKIEAQRLLAEADDTADAILTAQYGFCDILDKKIGAAYDRIVFAILAEKVPHMTMAELLELAA